MSLPSPARPATTRRASVATTLALALALGLAATTAAASTAAPSATAASAAPCQISGGGDMSEYSLTVTFKSKGVTCAQAKVVMKACVKRSTVQGWKVAATDSGRVRFTNKADKTRRFVALPAGGSIACVDKALGV